MLVVVVSLLVVALLVRLQFLLLVSTLCPPRSEELRWKPLDPAPPARVSGEGFGDTDTAELTMVGRTMIPTIVVVAAAAAAAAGEAILVNRTAPGVAAVQ